MTTKTPTIVARCVRNSLHSIDSDDVRTRLGQAIHRDGPNTDLVIDREYKVQAIEQRDGGLWLFIHSVPSSKFPYPYPSEFFEIASALIPDGWVAQFRTSSLGTVLKRLSFPEWATDDTFYEKLVDEDSRAIEAYKLNCFSESGTDWVSC